MSRRYGQVPLNLWRNPAFQQLADDARLVVLFFWSGPHSTSAGVGIVPDAYASHDLGWSRERWQAARQEAEGAGFIRRDAETETVLVCGYLESNRPTNTKHRAAIVGQINSIDCDDLRQAALAGLEAIDGESNAPSNAPPTAAPTPQLLKILGGRR